MQDEYEHIEFLGNKIPVYRVTEIIDMKIVLTDDPIFPWVVINPQDNGH